MGETGSLSWAQVIYKIPWIRWIQWRLYSFRKNSNVAIFVETTQISTFHISCFVSSWSIWPRKCIKVFDDWLAIAKDIFQGICQHNHTGYYRIELCTKNVSKPPNKVHYIFFDRYLDKSFSEVWHNWLCLSCSDSTLEWHLSVVTCAFNDSCYCHNSPDIQYWVPMGSHSVMANDIGALYSEVPSLYVIYTRMGLNTLHKEL